ncbi:MAG: hypothetical protein R2785_05680 [Flavobacteriaceae bacterium]
MKYFSILNSLDVKTMGCLPQVKQVIHNCDVLNNENFIDKFPFRKIEKKPILSNAILYAKSNQTDLIKTNSIGFSYGSMLISDRFKNLLEKFNFFGIQFFSTSIFHKDEKIGNYWQTHIYDVPYNLIDFKNTDFVLKDRDVNRKPMQNSLKILSKEEYLNIAESMKYPKMLFLKNVSFTEKMNLDYFFLRNFEGASLGIVSYRLMEEIEKNTITGIELKPFEVDLQTWYKSKEREEKYGKS